MPFYNDQCLYCREDICYHPICPKTGESKCQLCDDCDAAEVVAS